MPADENLGPHFAILNGSVHITAHKPSNGDGETLASWDTSQQLSSMQKNFTRLIELEDMELQDQTMIAYTIQNKGMDNHGFETCIYPSIEKKLFKMSYKAIPECLKQIEK